MLIRLESEEKILERFPNILTNYRAWHSIEDICSSLLKGVA